MSNNDDDNDNFKISESTKVTIAYFILCLLIAGIVTGFFILLAETQNNKYFYNYNVSDCEQIEKNATNLMYQHLCNHLIIKKDCIIVLYGCLK